MSKVRKDDEVAPRSELWQVPETIGDKLLFILVYM